MQETTTGLEAVNVGVKAVDVGEAVVGGTVDVGAAIAGEPEAVAGAATTIYCSIPKL